MHSNILQGHSKRREGDFLFWGVEPDTAVLCLREENVLGRRVVGGTISLLGDGESALLNEILCCQTCAILSSSSCSCTHRTRSPLSKFGISPTNVLCRSGLARKFADPNTVLSQSLSDVTPILNGISATDYASPFGSGAQYCKSKRNPLSLLDVPFHIKETDARGGQKLRLPRDEEARCIEIGRETTVSVVYVD